MNNKNIALIFIGIITLVGVMFGILRTDVFSKELYGENAFTLIENYPLQDGISTEALEKLDTEKYLVLYSSNDPGSLGIKENVEKTLDYVKKPYESIEVKAFKGFKYRVSGVIACFENLDELPRIEEVFNYVKQGGGLMFAQRLLPSEQLTHYQDQLGIEKTLGVSGKNGIALYENLLLNENNFNENSAFISNSSLNVILKASSKKYAGTGDGSPLIWDTVYGRGKVVFCNGTMLYDTGNRGLIIALVGLLQPDFMYPIINAKVNFIDDFPAPIPSGQAKNIYRQVDINTEQFYRMIWWPDMLRTAENYQMKYSGVVIESYNNKVEAPFAEDDPSSKDSLFFFGEELLNNGGEIGIHGYNHQSLSFDEQVAAGEGYHVWKSHQDVKASLEEVHRFVKKLYPKYDFRVYVPPSNILGEEIREKFTELYPEIKVIASLYANNNYGGRYVQEFERAKDGIIEFPRFSWGYMLDNADLWNIYNGISLHGVISHFVHPDDVLNEARGQGKTWEELYKSYDSLWQRLYNKYGWLRPMTASEAAEELKKYLDCKVYITQNQNTLYGYCQDFRKDMYFILRTSKKAADPVGGSIKKIDKDVYLVYVSQPKFSIELKEAQ